MSCNRWFLPAALIVAGLASSRVEAGLITFEFSGIASGSLDGMEFVDSPFQFTLVTDTDGVFQPFPRFPNIINTQNADLNFTINGISGTFTDPFAVFRNSFGPNSSVGLAPDSGNDLLSITNSSLAAYDLKSSFGPLTQAPPDFLNVGEPYATSAGALIFMIDDPDNSSVTFQASVAVVPEPGTIMMLVSGVACLGIVSLLRGRWSLLGKMVSSSLSPDLWCHQP